MTRDELVPSVPSIVGWSVFCSNDTSFQWICSWIKWSWWAGSIQRGWVGNNQPANRWIWWGDWWDSQGAPGVQVMRNRDSKGFIVEMWRYKTVLPCLINTATCHMCDLSFFVLPTCELADWVTELYSQGRPWGGTKMWNNANCQSPSNRSPKAGFFKKLITGLVSHEAPFCFAFYRHTLNSSLLLI